MPSITSSPGSGAGTGWTTPQNIISSNDQTASITCVDTTPSTQLKASNYNLSSLLPTYTINGVAVHFEIRSGAGNTGFNTVKLFYNGVEHSATDTPKGPVTDTEQILSYGSSSDTWGGITVSDLQHSSFEVRSTFANGGPFTDTIFIDHIQLEVYYSDSAGGVDSQHYHSSYGSQLNQLKTKLIGRRGSL